MVFKDDGVNICMCLCVLLVVKQSGMLSAECLYWCDAHLWEYHTGMDVFISMFACYYITTSSFLFIGRTKFSKVL